MFFGYMTPEMANFMAKNVQKQKKLKELKDEMTRVLTNMKGFSMSGLMYYNALQQQYNKLKDEQIKLEV